jgi:hypothetical protein
MTFFFSLHESQVNIYNGSCRSTGLLRLAIVASSHSPASCSISYFLQISYIGVLLTLNNLHNSAIVCFLAISLKMSISSIAWMACTTLREFFVFGFHDFTFFCFLILADGGYQVRPVYCYFMGSGVSVWSGVCLQYIYLK